MITSLPLSLFCFATVSLATVVPVEVTRTDGEAVSGNLQAITESVVMMDREGTTQEIPLDTIVQLRSTRADTATAPVMRVLLLGGSAIAAQGVTLTEDQCKIGLRKQDDFVVPVRRVRAIRIRAGAPATDPQWLGMLEGDGSGDVLVIRRDADRLDQIRGIVEGIENESVRFNVDGNQVQAPFDRLEGIIFDTTRRSESQPTTVQVMDAYGSRWSAEALNAGSIDEPLQLILEAGQAHSIPWNLVESIRWNSSMVLLATQSPAQALYKPYLDSGVLSQAMAKWFAPASDGNEDVLMYGDSSVVYRVDPGFERLVGSVQRSPTVDYRSQVTVSIQFDGQTVWTQALSDDATSGFELPLGQARQVELKVETAGDGDLGDTVRFRRPRLLK